MHSVPVSPDRAKPFSPKSHSAARAQQDQPSTDERLGTRGTVFPPPPPGASPVPDMTRDFVRQTLAEDRAVERKAERFANRRLLWKLSGEKSVQACGRGVVDSALGVAIKRRANTAYVSGVTRCGAIWLDPVCSAKIRAERATEIADGIIRHIKAGGTAYMVTLTVQHHKRHELAALLDALKAAFKALLSGAQWAGDPKRGREGEKRRMGVLGIIRSIEVTVGMKRHGWHPHIHVVVLMGARQNPRPSIPRKKDRPADWVKPDWDPTPTSYFRVPDPSEDRDGMTEAELKTVADFERMQERWTRVWERWTAKAGFRASAKHGVKWDRVESVRDAEGLGDYLAKTQDGKNVGAEVARGDMKNSRVKGNLTPFELLTRYRQLRNMTASEMEGLAKAGLPVDKELGLIAKTWAEYEKATKGRRAMEWSPGLRAALGLGSDEDEPTDEEIVEQDEHGDAAAHLSAPAWGKICRLGMDYKVLRAVETGGIAELAVLLAAVGLEAETASEWIDQERTKLPNRGRPHEVEVVQA